MSDKVLCEQCGNHYYGRFIRIVMGLNICTWCRKTPSEEHRPTKDTPALKRARRAN